MYTIVLVDVGTPRNELSEPIGIETLASRILRDIPGASVALKSLELESVTALERFLNEHAVHIVGISSKINAFRRICSIVELVRKRGGNTPIIIGDVVSTFAYNDVLRLYDNVICVRGEGEDAIAGLVRCYRQYKGMPEHALSKIPNVAFTCGGQIITTQRSAADLRNAEHPKRVFLKELASRWGIVHVEASRGCVYSNCSFCGTNEKYACTPWRAFDIEFVIQELRTISDAGFGSPYFTDEDFFGDDVKHVVALASAILLAKQEGRIAHDMNFYLNARVNSILGENYGGIAEAKGVLALLKKAGLREIFVGIESGASGQLRRYGKGTTIAKNVKALSVLDHVGIDLDTGFIFFDPSAKLSDLRENLTIIYKAGLNTNYSRLVKRLRLQPFTEITRGYLQRYPNARMNLNWVCYDYDFEDQAVACVYGMFSEWERGTLDAVYPLQSMCRGEVMSEVDRCDIKRIISLWRFLDIEYVNAIITAFENRYSSDRYLRRIDSEFRQIRSCLSTQLAPKVAYYTSKYAR